MEGSFTSPASDPGLPDNMFVDPTRACSLLKGMSALYENKQFVDVSLLIGDSEYPCHKNVLAISRCACIYIYK